MAGLYDDYHIPNLDIDNAIPREEHVPQEDSPVKEDQASFDEFNENYVGPDGAKTDEELARESARHHDHFRKLFLRPMAAMLIGVGVMTAALGIDHLGQDYLVNDYLDSFPVLPNPDPDWEGKFDWSRQSAEESASEYAREIAREYGVEYYKEAYEEMYHEIYKGPEIYLSYKIETESGIEAGYLVKGATWEYYNPDVPLTEGPEDGSLRYDRATNTLTLNNFNGSLIDANVMGNAFTIRVLGENRVDRISIWNAGYSGSVTFTGDGKLTIGQPPKGEEGSEEDHNDSGGEFGLWLGDESYMLESGRCGSACLMVDREVTLDIYGNLNSWFAGYENAAVIIEYTAMKDAVYWLKPIRLTGGSPTSKSLRELFSDEPHMEEHEFPECYFATIVDEKGKPASHVVFEPKK